MSEVTFLQQGLARRSVLSYSTEHEFIIKYGILDQLDTSLELLHDWQLGRVVRSRLIEYLNKFGLEAVNFRTSPDDLATWVVERGRGVKVDDFDVELDEWGYCPVKLTSPVFLFNDPASFFQLDQVLTLIKDGYSAFVNDSCSLVVRIGNVPHDNRGEPTLMSFGYPYGTTANVLTFAVAFQEQIDTIHPPERVDGGPYCLTPAGLYPRVRQSRVLRRVEKCTNLSKLFDVWDGYYDAKAHGDRALTYSIANLVPRYDGEMFRPGNGTFRFGQHAGTLDFDETRHWVKTVGHIVRVSECARAEGSWPSGLTKYFDGVNPVKLEDMSAYTLLKQIQAKPEADYYLERIAAHPFYRDLVT